MSGALNRITASLYNTTAAFGNVHTASNSAFDSAAVQAITQEMYGYEQRIQSLESELINANNQIERMQEETELARTQASNLDSMFRRIGSAVAAIGIGAMAKEAIDYASDLQEVQNVVDVTFGENSSVNDWAKTTLDAFGLNELSAKQFSGTMGAMLKSSGLAGDSVQEMAMKITELSGDMASFYNLDAEDAFNKLRSGISGETEPLKQLGINMSVANLEAYALSQGIKTSYSKMSQAEQVLLRYNYLLSATGDAQGDFSRTSDSFANQTKLLQENWNAFTGDMVTKALPILAQGIQWLNSGINTLSAFAQGVSDNWAVISPILGAVVTVMGLYTAAIVANNIAQGINTVITGAQSLAASVHAASLMLQTGATFGATAAQHGFNAALMACPITWIILAIVAVIAIIFLVIAAINELTGSTYSATGIICGVIATAGAFIYNTVIGLVNAVITYGVNLYNMISNFAGGLQLLFTNPLDGIKVMFLSIFDFIVGIVEAAATLLDTVFGSELADTVAGFRDTIQTEINTTLEANGLETQQLDASDYTFDRIAYGDAFNAGNEFGESLGDKFSGMLSGFGADTGAGTDSALTNMCADLSGINGNTAAVADSVNVSNENLAYMRDLAEQEVINRFTTASVRVEMGGVTNNVSSNTDLDGLVSYLSDGVGEALQTTAEGVHV